MFSRERLEMLSTANQYREANLTTLEALSKHNLVYDPGASDILIQAFQDIDTQTSVSKTTNPISIRTHYVLR